MSTSLNVEVPKVKATDFREAALRFFEPQLIALGVGSEQIESQNLEELGQSLEILNEASQHPESFGVLKMNMSSGGSVLMTKSESHITVGILPILLERKKSVKERISLLTKKEEILGLREKVESTLDQNEREEYEKKLNTLQAAVNTLEDNRIRNEEQLRNAEQALLEAQSEAKKLEIEEKREKFKLETWERRTRIWQKFLERESVATIVGGILLIIVTVFLIVATIWNVKALDLLSNAFLVILGYFFGQSVAKKPSSSKEDVES